MGTKIYTPIKPDWRWIAGFWEGDGSAGCYFYKRRHWIWHRSIVQLVQKDKEPLKIIKQMVGYGSLRLYKGSGFSKTNKYWKYSICSLQALKFIKNILPFVKSKRRITQLQKTLQDDSKFVNHEYNK